MRNVMALTRREMISIFCSPLAWVVLALFLGFTGLFFIRDAATLQASMAGAFQVVQFISLFAVPLITMRLLSEEYRSGSIESLMTAPVTDAEVVIGKFLGALAFYLCMLAPTLVYVAILRRYGGIELGPVAAGYIGLTLMGAMFIALGLLCSALTQHQILSGAAALVLLLLLCVGNLVALIVGPDIRPLMDYAVVGAHLTAFSDGRIPLRDSFYFLSFTGFFLFLAVRAVESRRWRAAGTPERGATLWGVLTRGAIALGAACILAGLVARQIFAGALFSHAAVLAPIVSGAGLMALGILLNIPWLWRLFRRRSFRAGLNVWAASALSLLVLTVANAIIAATPQTDAWFIDMTRQRVHSLSEKSRSILKGLDREVTLTALYATGEVSLGYGGKPEDATQRLKDLLRLYQARGVKTQWVDLFADKLKAQQTAVALNVPLEPDTLVVSAGAQHAQIPLASLFAIDYAYGTMPVITGFQGEEKVTSAIVALTERKQIGVFFLTGHGELAPGGEPAKSLTEFTGDLRRDNMLIGTLNLSQAGAVPRECSLLVIPGPTAPFPAQEAQRIEEYLDGGGKLLLAVKPRVAGGRIAGLEALLARYNLSVSDDQVVIEIGQDLRSGAQAGGISFYTTFQAGHAITRDLGALNCYVLAASPVAPLMADTAPTPGAAPALRSDWAFSPLLMTSPQGWGETSIADKPATFDEKKDRRGPLAIAAAVSRKSAANAPAQGTRIVLLGTTALLDDGALTANQGNRTFALNCVNWLTERETHLGIPPQRTERKQLAVTPALFRAIFFLTVFVMPLAAAIAGVWVWWVRRR